MAFMLNHISISYEYKVMIYNLNAAGACVFFSNDKSVGTIISYKTFAWVQTSVDDKLMFEGSR